MRTTLIPAAVALSSAAWTFGLVGVMAIAFTPWVIIDSMAAISPSSSVPLLPWAKTSSTSGWSLAHVLAASTMMS